MTYGSGDEPISFSEKEVGGIILHLVGRRGRSRTTAASHPVKCVPLMSSKKSSTPNSPATTAKLKAQDEPWCLGAEQMAAKLGICRSQFYQLVREGRLPAAHVPGALGDQKWDVFLTWLAYLRLIGEERIMMELGIVPAKLADRRLAHLERCQNVAGSAQLRSTRLRNSDDRPAGEDDSFPEPEL